MNDFAAAAMLRLIALGLARQGLPWPQGLPPQRAVGAHVPLADKRLLLQALWNAHGPIAVLRIGDAVHDAADEPALLALTLDPDPAAVVQRWQRLERFIHSRHRLLAEVPAPGLLRLHHVSQQAAQPPWPAEDLLVLGVLVGLAERAGARRLRARLVGDAGWRRRDGRWVEPAAGWPDDCGHWELDWQAAKADAPPPAPCVAHDLLAAARAQLAADPAARWSIGRLALRLGLAPRTLQRELAARGSGFRPLLAAVRLSEASRRLAEGQLQVAEIGYLCGFSDQAHFTRCFRRDTALTPAAWRQRFAAASAGRA